jgi:hypothetical protein
MRRFTLVAGLVVVLSVGGAAIAAPTVITDTTPGTASNDGTVGVGEYVGSSAGINAGFGDVIGANSQLHVDSDTSGNLNFGLVTGGGGLFDRIVMYIDSVGGGFADTVPFDDSADPLRAAISGSNTSGTAGSQLAFAPGFEADYAIGIEGGFAGLWQLVGGGSHTFLTSVNLMNSGNEYEIDLTMADLGLAAGGSFRYVATYGNPFDGGGFYRSDEFHGVAQSTVPGGNPGLSDVTLATGDYNVFNSVPEPSTLLLLGLAFGSVAVARVRRR